MTVTETGPLTSAELDLLATPRLLGHWLNRVIRSWDLNVSYVAGPGPGGPGMVAREVHPAITPDAAEGQDAPEIRDRAWQY